MEDVIEERARVVGKFEEKGGLSPAFLFELQLLYIISIFGG